MEKRKNEQTVEQPKPEVKIFEWMTQYQEEFNALEEVLNTAAVLGYPDFSKEFILEIAASLQGLETILF